MANSYLTKTFGTPTDTKKYTMSVWVKRSSLGVQQSIARSTNGSDDSHVFTFNSDDTLRWDEYGSSSSIGKLVTNRKFRDTNSFYHVVLKWDTANSTAGDRMKMWINGVEETSFSTDTNPSLNATSAFNKASQPINIGRTSYGSGGNYFDGVLSHFHFIDGTAYDASAFGETDATTGEWKGKTSPSVTYGNNGFFILKDGNGITDQSGEGNDFTLGGGTLTDLKDNPDNVFATGNPIGAYRTQAGRPSFSNGNNTIYFNNASYNEIVNSTLSLTGGNFYWETKIVSIADSYIGIVKSDDYTNGWTQANVHYLYITNGQKRNGDTATSYGSSYTTGDIIGCAWNGTTGTIWFSKNGVWQNSATITEIANGTTTNSAFTGLSSATDGNAWLTFNSDYNDKYQNLNFGNGYFGTTAVSSAGTNASDNGIFEYDVPTGYTALSTKGLNE